MLRFEFADPLLHLKFVYVTYVTLNSLNDTFAVGFTVKVLNGGGLYLR